jgi:hypothetical protein
MDVEERFKLVFERLEATKTEEGNVVETIPRDELDEIEELRRFSAELNQQSSPALFTTT